MSISNPNLDAYMPEETPYCLCGHRWLGHALGERSQRPGYGHCFACSCVGKEATRWYVWEDRPPFGMGANRMRATQKNPLRSAGSRDAMSPDATTVMAVAALDRRGAIKAYRERVAAEAQ